MSIHLHNTNISAISEPTGLLTTTNPPQSYFGRTVLPSLMAENELTACASCAIPTVDESNQSEAGMLHPHHSATFYLY